jgi:HEPN domain-containing protein
MQSHEKWLLKAQNDLNAAKLLYKADYLDVSIYHTQQCAEKALKGFLAYCKHPLVKTHDLVALIALCRQYESRFSKLNSYGEMLTPFGTLFRYPDLDIYPKKQTVLTAIRNAEKILIFVSKKID